MKEEGRGQRRGERTNVGIADGVEAASQSVSQSEKEATSRVGALMKSKGERGVRRAGHRKTIEAMRMICPSGLWRIGLEGTQTARTSRAEFMGAGSQRVGREW